MEAQARTKKKLEGAVRGRSKEMHIDVMCMSLKNARGWGARTWKGFGSLLSSNGLSPIVIEISRARACFCVFFCLFETTTLCSLYTRDDCRRVPPPSHRARGDIERRG